MLLFRKISGIIKLRIFPGKANTSPPIGSSLGQKGLNVSEFCKNFNKYTSSIDNSYLLNVFIKYYSDKSYDFFIKNPSISFIIKNFIFLKIEKYFNFSNLLEIFKIKNLDFNNLNFYSCLKIIIAVLKSMNYNSFECF